MSFTSIDAKKSRSHLQIATTFRIMIFSLVPSQRFEGKIKIEKKVIIADFVHFGGLIL
jgi:hypothetical protein